MITSTSNARVKRLVNLKKKAKERTREQVFIVEGIRMFREVPAEELKEIYASESFYKKEGAVIDEIARKSKVTPEILSDSVFAYVSDTKSPQGILCIVSQKKTSFEDMIQAENPHILVLDNLQDPGNLGTILRTGEGAGVTGILMSPDCCDVYNPKVIRSTMGSVYRMPFMYAKTMEEFKEDIQRLKDAGVKTYAAHLAGKNSYDKEDYTGPTAFFIGNEGNGLRDEIAEMADVYIRIPMAGQVESLNAAVATTVLIFETARQRRG